MILERKRVPEPLVSTPRQSLVSSNAGAHAAQLDPSISPVTADEGTSCGSGTARRSLGFGAQGDGEGMVHELQSYMGKGVLQ